MDNTKTPKRRVAPTAKAATGKTTKAAAGTRPATAGTRPDDSAAAPVETKAGAKARVKPAVSPRTAAVATQPKARLKAATRRSPRRKAMREAKYAVGQVVRHRVYPFRGVVFDIDPVFNNTEEWWLSIPEEIRPRKDQPYYHLLAENEETEYIAYVSEQNLLPDQSGVPVRHPQVAEMFVEDDRGHYRALFLQAH